MKLAALLSGGKDSLYATYIAGRTHEIRVIVTIKSHNPESYMYHVPNVELVRLQASAMRLPLIFRYSAGVKEEELGDLKTALHDAQVNYGIEGVVSGAIGSKYQKNRIDRICEELGLVSLAPLWGRDRKELWNEMLDAGFEILITAVAAYGLTCDWLGRKMDREALEELGSVCHVDTAGEGGEFETLVVNCPLFNERIRIVRSSRVWDARTLNGQFIIEKAVLERRMDTNYSYMSQPIHQHK